MATRDPAVTLLWVISSIGIAALAMLQAPHWQDGVAFVGGLVAVIGILWAVANGTLRILRQIPTRQLGFSWHHGIANLHRPQNRTSLLLISLGLGTFLMLTLHLVRDVLLHQLYPEVRIRQPNALLFDIQNDQRLGVRELVQTNGFPILEEAPLITMRLIKIKNRPVAELLAETNSTLPGWILRREFRSTWRSNLTATEVLVAGNFTGSALPGANPIPVSVEETITRDLHLQLGDLLEWDIQGISVRSVVDSIRKVDWRQVRPNFFVVFPAGAIEDSPATHVLATHVPNAQASARLQREVVDRFPNVSAIDLSLVLATVQNILDRVGWAIRGMALFTVATGLVVLIGTVTSGRWQRVREASLLRILGASKLQLRQILAIEYGVLGLIGSLCGVVLAIAGSWALSRFAFESDFLPSATPIVVTLFSVTGLTLLTGLFSSRGVSQQSPLDILRQE